MKKKYWFIFCVFIILIFIFIFLFQGSSSSVSKTHGESANSGSSILTQKKSLETETFDMDGKFKPEWGKELEQVNDSRTLSRNEKLDIYTQLLEKYNKNPDAIKEILLGMSTINPIEKVDEIIPYLNDHDEYIQNAALGALSNASLLTEEEHLQRKSLPQYDQIRNKISKSVNQLYENEKTSDKLKESIISSYGTTNPSDTDTTKMLADIFKSGHLSDNRAAYVANTLTNGKNLDDSLNSLSRMESIARDAVISSIGNNILNNPQTVDILNFQQKQKFIDFIRKNPPSTSTEQFGSQQDLWNNTLNLLTQSTD